jgi:hypothetical protein
MRLLIIIPQRKKMQFPLFIIKYNFFRITILPLEVVYFLFHLLYYFSPWLILAH